MPSFDEGESDYIVVLILIAQLWQSIAECYLILEEMRACAANQILARRSLSEVTRNMTDEEFLRTFRLMRQTFSLLCNVLEPNIVRNEEMGRRSSTDSIDTRVQIALFLGILAGAQYHDVMMTFGISRPTVYKITHSVCTAVISELSLGGIPNTPESCEEAAAAFSNSRSFQNSLKGCVGALDWIEIEIEKPRCIPNPLHFWNRKGFYAISVQAICDARYRFLHMSALCAG